MFYKLIEKAKDGSIEEIYQLEEQQIENLISILLLRLLTIRVLANYQILILQLV